MLSKGSGHDSQLPKRSTYLNLRLERLIKRKKLILIELAFFYLVAGAGHSTTTHTNILKNIKFILKITPYFFVDVIHSLAPYTPSFPKRQEHFSILKFHNYKI